MTTYILRRLVAFVPTMFGISFLVFLMLYFVPGDPAQMILGVDATPAAVQALQVSMGLDQPFVPRLLGWYGRAVQGDFGRSYYLNRSVVEAIAERVPVTLQLTGIGLIIAILIGVPAGIIASVRQNTWIDALVMGGAMLGLALPGFLLGLLLIFFVALPTGWFPTGGYVPLFQDPLGNLRSLALPGLSLGLAQGALIARMTRSSMLEVLRLDYVRTARAKGLHEQIIINRHVLANSLIPIITVIGIVAGVLLGGAIAIETVFTLPGVGRLVISAVKRRDYPLIQGVILFITFSYLAVNLVVDLLYMMVNPRVRYS
ncbi:MAG: ABC transporter permease [Trueperaceae bacterium]